LSLGTFRNLWIQQTFFSSIAGVYIVTLVEETDERNDVRGILWALLGSLGYAAYLVLLRRRVKDESKLDIAMFFGAKSNISTPYCICSRLCRSIFDRSPLADTLFSRRDWY
jgi:drug/metabolite transporter (DMT)-like permease